MINLDALIEEITQGDRVDLDYTRLFIPWNWWILWRDAYLLPMDRAPDAVSREAHSWKGTPEPPLSSPRSQRL